MLLFFRQQNHVWPIFDYPTNTSAVGPFRYVFDYISAFLVFMWVSMGYICRMMTNVINHNDTIITTMYIVHISSMN